MILIIILKNIVQIKNTKQDKMRDDKIRDEKLQCIQQ